MRRGFGRRLMRPIRPMRPMRPLRPMGRPYRRRCWGLPGCGCLTLPALLAGAAAAAVLISVI